MVKASTVSTSFPRLLGHLSEEVPHEDGGVGVGDAGGHVGDPGLLGTPRTQLHLPEHHVCRRGGLGLIARKLYKLQKVTVKG